MILNSFFSVKVVAEDQQGEALGALNGIKALVG